VVMGNTHLVLHLLLLRGFDFADFLHGINPYAGAVDFDLVRVHRGVRDENLRVFDALGVPDVELFVKNKPLVLIVKK
jgi:hypothetical protein